MEFEPKPTIMRAISAATEELNDLLRVGSEKEQFMRLFALCELASQFTASSLLRIASELSAEDNHQSNILAQ